MDLLLAFVEDGPELGITDLSRRLALPKATVHRLVEALVARDLLRRDPHTARYGLGLMAFRLGSAFLRALDVRQAALPVMQALARQTGETVNLNIVQSGHRVCIEKVESVQDVRHFVELGRPLPLFAGASGKVLLAHLDPPAVEAVLRQQVRPLTARTVTDRGRIREELARIRQRGYAVSAGERVDGASAVSAPVRNAQGEVVAGLTVSGPSYRFTPGRVRTLIPMVLEAAAAISRSVGYLPGPADRSTATEVGQAPRRLSRRGRVPTPRRAGGRRTVREAAPQ
ncbi:MAG: IclR family transcriptional regulator [Armatimonadota bacterium]|nr:IclR family transcriptional regulator [Armatimonadota bacterium]MDR7449910.1 IclR family transcriptional regulator [Armatimonadota bacterium]MDR7460089.1 IclR family transcriptional regulator [Armatimonadota bacterium]MDR7480631.1 IclR family transcriptional regulator [Armatimonadota bacterium]MDR7491058.1 IclR family transcriptional regulator [Armatimonadota bacterium]